MSHCKCRECEEILWCRICGDRIKTFEDDDKDSKGRPCHVRCLELAKKLWSEG